ncbi:MlaD family protein [Sulfurimonas diazotrophicus]|uniref:MlaD family protein n=1 Tax=Sulfurimonas diazotrophicus TaxID=3131939 RepID=A0ABZ3H832_9BACT
MNAKTNETVVGIFVLLSLALMAFFVIWMLQPAKKDELQSYRIEFGESVSGLNVDSPVKFRGVTVGKVSAIRISPKNIEKIEVIIDVWKTTPVKTDTIAKLKSQGITGLSYVDLSRGSEAAPLLRSKEEDAVPTIPFEPSFFVTLERTFGSASENISELLLRLKELIGEQNQEELTRLLYHSANIVEKIDTGLTKARFAHLDETVRNVGKLATALDARTSSLPKLLQSSDAAMGQVKVSLASLQESFDSMAETLEVINARNKNGDYSIKETMGPGMAQFEVTMRQMEQSLTLLNQMLLRYGENPSDMLFEHQPPQVGPGEAR